MVLPLASGEFAPLAPSGRPAFWAVTGRLGGVSRGPFDQANLADHVGDSLAAVMENRASLAAVVDLSSEHLVHMAPVHGSSHAFVDSGGQAGEVDALITTSDTLGLVALGADCATVGIHAWGPESGVAIAAVHCGWKGLCADVLGATLAQLRSLGATKFQAVIGPAICGGCYKVGEERIQSVTESCAPDVARAALAFAGGIDVREGLFVALTVAGIPTQIAGGCTFENSEELFSYRRNNVTGRQGLVIRIGGASA